MIFVSFNWKLNWPSTIKFKHKNHAIINWILLKPINQLFSFDTCIMIAGIPSYLVLISDKYITNFSWLPKVPWININLVLSIFVILKIFNSLYHDDIIISFKSVVLANVWLDYTCLEFPEEFHIHYFAFTLLSEIRVILNSAYFILLLDLNDWISKKLLQI